MFDYTEYVRAGIKFLDKNAPADWRNRIDWSTVNIYSVDTCIAGQAIPPKPFADFDGSALQSGYGQACDIIFEIDEWLNDEDFGFNTHSNDDSEPDDFYSPEENLIRTWKRELGVTG